MPGAAAQHGGTEAGEVVVARVPVHRAGAQDIVVAIAGRDRVVADRVGDVVVTAAAEHLVVAILAVEPVAPGAALEVIVAAGAV